MAKIDTFEKLKAKAGEFVWLYNVSCIEPYQAKIVLGIPIKRNISLFSRDIRVRKDTGERVTLIYDNKEQLQLTAKLFKEMSKMWGIYDEPI